MTIAIYQAPFDATNLAGNVIGTTFAIADLPLFKGRISEDLRTIIFQHDMPGIETITGPFANLGIVTRQRICTRERTATKIRRGSA